MNKPKNPLSGSVRPERQTAGPSAVIPRREDIALAAAYHPAIPPTSPAKSTGQQGRTEYVDPYLFETGFYADRAEYEELTRTAPIRSRAEAEKAPPRRRTRK